MWRNIYCFDFIFIALNTSILGHKVTLQRHIRVHSFLKCLPLAALYFKRWLGSCGCLDLLWFGLWIFCVWLSDIGYKFRMPGSNSCLELRLYEFDPLKQTVLHLENLALLSCDCLCFRVFPFIFYCTGYEILQLFHFLKQIAREMNKLFVQKSTIIALVLMGFFCWNLHFWSKCICKVGSISWLNIHKIHTFHWGHSPFPKH